MTEPAAESFQRATPAPALLQLLRQVDARAPHRSRGYDGIMRDPRIGPPSDHHVGNAIDLTHDPAGGLDAGRLALAFVRQMKTASAGRLTYVIWDRRIWSAKTHWNPRPYGRSCPHVKHVHLSIRADRRHITRPWTLE